MNQQKESHVHRTRLNSAYPAFRGLINFCVALAYVIALLEALISLAFLPRAWYFTLAGFLIAALSALVARAAQEVAFMLADIADRTLDFHALSSSQRPPDVVSTKT